MTGEGDGSADHRDGGHAVGAGGEEDEDFHSGRVVSGWLASGAPGSRTSWRQVDT